MEKDGCCGKHEHDHNHGHQHNHEHGDCACDHDHEDLERIVISVDGEIDLECDVLGVFEVEDREYIALLPVGDEEVIIFRYSGDDEESNLSDIETDEEYASVSEVFYEIFLSGDDKTFNIDGEPSK